MGQDSVRLNVIRAIQPVEVGPDLALQAVNRLKGGPYFRHES